MRVPDFFSDASKKLFLHFSMAGLFCIITLQLLCFGHSLENLLIFRKDGVRSGTKTMVPTVHLRCAGKVNYTLPNP